MPSWGFGLALYWQQKKRVGKTVKKQEIKSVDIKNATGQFIQNYAKRKYVAVAVPHNDSKYLTALFLNEPITFPEQSESWQN